MRRLYFATPFVLVFLCAPATWSGDKKDDKKDDMAAFDAHSPVNTLRWVVDLWQGVQVVTGNELAKEKRQSEMDAALRQLNGKAIDWTLEVSVVRKAGIVFKAVSIDGKAIAVDSPPPPAPPPPAPPPPPAKKAPKKPAPKKSPTPPPPPPPASTAPKFLLIVGATDAKADQKVKAADGIAKPFPVQPDDWVLELRPGSKVRLEGKVAGVEHAATAGGFRIGFAIADFKLSPVKKE